TKIIDDFMAKNPDVAVKVEVVHWSKMAAMLITASGAGQAPDVALVHSSRMPMAIEAGAVIPLDSYVAGWSEREKKDLLLPFEAYLYKKHLYSLPWEHRVENVLMYRKDLFDKAGIVGPPRIWTEMESAGRKLTGPNLWGLVWALSRKDAAANVRVLESLHWSLGGDFYHPDGTAAVNSPIGIRIAQTIAALVQQAKIMPAGILGVEEGRSMTKAGTAAMLVDGSQVVGSIQAGKGIGRNLRTAPLPSFEAGKPAPAIVAGQTLAITGNCKTPDVAWRFIQHMISPAAQILNAKIGQNMPTRRSAYDDPWFKSDEASDLVEWKNYAVAGGRPFPPVELSDFLNDSLAQAYEEILTGRAQIKEALDRAAARYNERLKQGK
ncbi:MAG TPA: extracellular solute-binding protein, partial [Candidatus Sulfotelmatobacter sp.]|nr:extracellular solute-binding protein [Candidatus Sulfotelmatobacter sp.]